MVIRGRKKGSLRRKCNLDINSEPLTREDRLRKYLFYNPNADLRTVARRYKVSYPNARKLFSDMGGQPVERDFFVSKAKQIQEVLLRDSSHSIPELAIKFNVTPSYVSRQRVQLGITDKPREFAFFKKKKDSPKMVISQEEIDYKLKSILEKISSQLPLKYEKELKFALREIIASETAGITFQVLLGRLSRKFGEDRAWDAISKLPSIRVKGAGDPFKLILKSGGGVTIYKFNKKLRL